MSTFRVVIFRIGDKFAAVEEKYSEEFFVLNQITRIPVSPAYMGNVVNWQGSIIPVIDIAPFFGDPVRPVVSKMIALAINTTGKESVFSIVTDGIDTVSELEESEEIKNDLPFFASSLLKFKDEEIFLVSPFKIEKFIINHLKKII
ncbi:chemotaxis protein CheW [Myxococcota bacterium]|nr:chemotaxis protein CheW [Myxococcota bacterium]MBU1381332.1 chemotaxis protein CheW [Myxococcota bacterium]MBU1495709.1 chemotaxis protein CheW [Myxococcota bacterium]